ncbi:MAG TPA: hypothetical protein VGF29_13015 [Hyphomicrobiaceae bacterium]
MPSWLPEDLPNLTDDNWICTSPYKRSYNCIAWAAGDNQTFWWPFAYWPDGVEREETLEAFIAAFATRGYSECADASLEDGYEKIALYAVRDEGIDVPTHAARQLADGRWTSKMGRAEDIEHNTLDAVVCPVYGAPVRYLRRPRQS